jgi:hypothetical protein
MPESGHRLQLFSLYRRVDIQFCHKAECQTN